MVSYEEIDIIIKVITLIFLILAYNKSTKK